MKLYIAGPMTGIPKKNFPAFAAATRALRRYYKVINPAALDADYPRQTWEACLKRDIVELLKCGGVATLPGWESSRGANLEVDIAMRLGLHVAPAGEWVTLARKARAYKREKICVYGR